MVNIYVKQGEELEVKVFNFGPLWLKQPNNEAAYDVSTCYSGVPKGGCQGYGTHFSRKINKIEKGLDYFNVKRRKGKLVLFYVVDTALQEMFPL